MIANPAISRYEGHGLTKPLPSFAWCALSLVRSGTAALDLGLETIAERREEVESLGFMAVEWKVLVLKVAFGYEVLVNNDDTSRHGRERIAWSFILFRRSRCRQAKCLFQPLPQQGGAEFRMILKSNGIFFL